MSIVDDVIKAYEQTDSAKRAAFICGISEHKARKILFEQGALSTETSIIVNNLVNDGLSAKEISDELGISQKAVNAYLPYKKGAYKKPDADVSKNAVYLRRWREKKTIADSADSGLN